MTKNLNEIIKANEEKFEREFDHYNPKNDTGIGVPTWSGSDFNAIKSHLHQSQLNIVEWVREWAKDKNKGLETDNNGNHTCNPRCHDSGREETLFGLLQELDKIV